MKLTALVIFLLSVGTAKGQLNSYYALGNQLYSSEVSKPDQPYLTELCFVQYRFANSRLTAFLRKTFEFEKILYTSKPISDSTALMIERWKSSKNPEINPASQFLEVKYTVQKIAYDTIITGVEFFGSEEYIGDIYKGFWNAGLNLKDKNGDVLCRWTFREDLIRLNYSDKKNVGTAYSPYWLTVQSTIEKPTEFKANLKTTLMDKKREQETFHALRSTKVYHYADIDTLYYGQKRDEIKLRLQTILNQETNSTGNIKVSVRADTLGGNWIEVTGKNIRVNQALRESLLTFYYKNHLEKEVKMNTSDDFSFDYECLREEVVLRKSNRGIHIQSVNNPVIAKVAREEAATEPLPHVDMIYNVNITKLNGVTTNHSVITSREEYTSFGAAVGTVLLGGVVIIGAILTGGEE